MLPMSREWQRDAIAIIHLLAFAVLYYALHT